MNETVLQPRPGQKATPSRYHEHGYIYREATPVICADSCGKRENKCVGCIIIHAGGSWRPQ